LIDGFQNVIRIDSEIKPTEVQSVFIRFETFEKMKAWMLDLHSESQQFADGDVEQIDDWWAGLYQDVSIF
jgi:hypothetical protein